MKSRLLTLLFVLFWGTSGYVAHGYCLGDNTKSFPYMYHEGFCVPWSYTGGPISLGVAYIEGGETHPYLQHGYTYEQRLDIFLKQMDPLDKEYFDQRYH